MKFLTWNVNHRTHKKEIPPMMAEALASLSPDIIVLTEYVPGPSHDRFIADLKALGFPHWMLSVPALKQNNILIISQIALEAGGISAPRIHDAPAVPSNVLHVRVPDKCVELLGLRMPAFNDNIKIRKEKRNAWWDWVITTAKKNEKHPFVIVGDFNTDPGYPDADGGVRFSHLQEMGWNHALPASGFSWWGKSKKGEFGKKLDHILLNQYFDIRNAEYITESGQYAFTKKFEAMSDHAVLLVDAVLKL
jgi:endonuclease/exonuclease/phosphatase family metal-dependent hydrolase